MTRKEWLRQEEESTPGHILLDTGRLSFLAIENGLGFRSANHVLPAPQLEFFRMRFPTMNAALFNFVFNRYAAVALSRDPLPYCLAYNVIRVPVEVFNPIRNSRQVRIVGFQEDDCRSPDAGAIERSASLDSHLIIEGWAPWRGENSAQGVDVLSSRGLRAEPLLTVQRPDIAELMQDYAYVKSGFRLRLSSMDGRPVGPEEIVMLSSQVAPRVGTSVLASAPVLDHSATTLLSSYYVWRASWRSDGWRVYSDYSHLEATALLRCAPLQLVISAIS